MFFLASQLSRRTRAEALVTQAMRIQKQNTGGRRYNELKGRGTGRICSLQRAFVISRFFSTFFSITGSLIIVRLTEDLVI